MLWYYGIKPVEPVLFFKPGTWRFLFQLNPGSILAIRKPGEQQGGAGSSRTSPNAELRIWLILVKFDRWVIQTSGDCRRPEAM
jgi:hypothetical protein